MQTKFKRHQKVKLLISPLEEDIESYAEDDVKVKPGAIGEVNIILPNGRYHLKISDKKGDALAYVAMDEENLENAEKN